MKTGTSSPVNPEPSVLLGLADYILWRLPFLSAGAFKRLKANPFQRNCLAVGRDVSGQEWLFGARGSSSSFSNTPGGIIVGLGFWPFFAHVSRSPNSYVWVNMPS